MTTIELLAHVRRLDIKLWVEGDALRYSAPPDTLTSELRTLLAAHKPALLALLRPTDGGQAGTAPPLLPVARDHPPRASFAQQRLWFLDQWMPGNPAYTIPTALRLSGELHTTALHHALQTIVARHEGLRTTFALHNDEPVQLIADTLSLPLPVLDLRLTPTDEREIRMQQTLTREARRPFDLARGPLLRATLLLLAEHEHVLLLVVHHSVADAWSLGVLYDELSALYTAYLEDQPDPLPPLAVQYADYTDWQRQWLQGAVLQQQRAYWQAHLGSDLPLLALPTDRPRPAVQTYDGATVPFVLPRPLTDALHALSQQHNTTLFMTLLAAFVALLFRYTYQTSIAVGTPIANRTRSELEPLIGFFVNTLVLRIEADAEMSFPTLLAHVRAAALGAYDNQDMPFEQVVEAVQPARDLSRQPLFQVMFSLQNTPAGDLSLPGLHVRRLPVQTNTAKFDLLLDMQETAQGLIGQWEYNTALFDHETVLRMTGHLHMLLAALAENPQQLLTALPLLTPGEQRQLVHEWNDTAVAYPDQHCLHQLVEAQVQRTPDAPAVLCGAQQLSYRELDTRANQLAHYLGSQGVGVGALVAICIERSPEMVISLLGVLKAGAAYVPLDTTYPTERLAFMLHDAQVAVLLTQEHLLPRLPTIAARVVCVDRARGELDEQPASAPTTDVHPGALAYVMYTSGSTGQPKGVRISHRAIVNHMYWMHETFPLAAHDCVFQKTPFSFDASVWEFYAPLMAGARLLLAEPGGHQDVAYLVRMLDEQHVTTLQLVPTLLRLLLAEPGFAELTSLRRIFVGGEILTRDLEAQVCAALPASELINLYGPTETTIDVLWWRCVCEGFTEGVVPIGYPIANTYAYILDTEQQLVPRGVVGEIYIGGLCLAQGYLNRPDMTAARFVPDPFQPDALVYRTGDLGRYLPNGAIEMIGRADQQVKLRGIRVELSEIEAVVQAHAAVQTAAVLAREDQPGNQRLVAYVVLAPEAAAAPTDDARPAWEHALYEHMRRTLPEYMLPGALVPLESLPLLPNGKLNRRALPAPDMARRVLATDYVAPRNPTEQELARIWAEVLGLDQVGVYDDFFELGGHSLQTMQLVARIGATFQRTLHLKTIFLSPTIAALAEQIESLPLSSAVPRRRRTDVPPDLLAVAQPTTRQPRPYLTIERRPLLALFATGHLTPVDSAALGYLEPDDPFRDMFRYDGHGLPLLRDVLETPWGRIAIILLPRLRAELYQDTHLVDVVIEALELAALLGARTLSLAGLIPSATDYGQAVLPAMSQRPHLPRITTGHATTTAAVVLSIKKLVEASGRALAHERVGYLGMGSVGTASLRLMLRVLPHPAELLLCDLYSKREALERVQAEVVNDLGFQGRVRIVESHAEVPAAFYESSLMVGATNVPDILDVRLLRPGTLIVDDSAPHCFNTAQAIERFQAQGDILFSEGGVLQACQPIERLRYLPRIAEQIVGLEDLASVETYHAQQITGCVFSSLLSASYDTLPPTLGLVRVSDSVRHYERLQELAFEAADPHCEAFAFSAADLKRFREHTSHIGNS